MKTGTKLTTQGKYLVYLSEFYENNMGNQDPQNPIKEGADLY